MSQILPAIEQAFMFKSPNDCENSMESHTFYKLKRKKRFKIQLEWKNLKLNSRELKKYGKKRIQKETILKKHVKKLTSPNINDSSSINLNLTSSKSSSTGVPMKTDVDKKAFAELPSTTSQINTPANPDKKKKRIRKKTTLKKNARKLTSSDISDSFSSINLNSTTSKSTSSDAPMKTDVDKKDFAELPSTTSQIITKPDKKKKRIRKLVLKKCVEKFNPSNSCDDSHDASINQDSTTLLSPITIRIPKSNWRKAGYKNACTFQPKSFPTLVEAPKVNSQPNELVRRSKRTATPKRKFSQIEL